MTRIGRHRSGRTPWVAVFLLLALLGWAHGFAGADTNRWNGLSSHTFTQAFVRVDIAAQPPSCQDDDFAVFDDSYVLCANEGHDGPDPYITFGNVDLAWDLSGFAGHLPPPPGDTPVGVLLNVMGQRVSHELLVVNVSIDEPNWPPVGATEVAVIRFSGDPNVFAGVEATGVEDLVDLGLIGSKDILAVASHAAVSDLDFQMTIDATGLGNEEIVIFAAAAGAIPGTSDVPATSPIGALSLALAFFGLGAWAMWQRG